MKASGIFFIFCLLTIQSQKSFSQNDAIISRILDFNADIEMYQSKYPLQHSRKYIEKMDSVYKNYTSQLKTIAYDSLNAPDQRLDYLLLDREIVIESFKIYQLQDELKKAERSMSFLNVFERFIMERVEGNSMDADFWSNQFNELSTNITTHLPHLKINLLKKQTTKEKDIRQLASIADEYLNAFRYAYKFYDGYDTLFTQKCKVNYVSVDSSFRRLRDSLNQWRTSDIFINDSSGIIGTPIGAGPLGLLLTLELIPYTHQELIEIGYSELEKCVTLLKQESRQMGYGDDWKKALELVKNDYVPMGQQPTLVKQISDEAIDFIEDNKLLNIPEKAKTGWYMRMLTPKEQKYAPFFLGGEQILIAYPHSDMSQEERMMTMRGNNKHFTRAIVHHELIPGHNLQHYYRQRFAPHRATFSSPYWSEGWAVYWELLMYQKGFAKTPEDRIGMLFWRMHRCARIIFSINYHVENWNARQCIDFLINEVGHEPANAEAEVRRSFTGGYGPEYQLAYMIGALQFLDLRKEWVDSGKMSDEVFHQKILEAGSMPIYYVKQMLNDVKDKDDYEHEWKWY